MASEAAMRSNELAMWIEEAQGENERDLNVQIVDEDGKSYEIVKVDDQGGDGSPLVIEVKSDA